MISDSRYWKNELLVLVRRIAKIQRAKRWSQKQHAHLEISLMLGFYVVRKLIEARKLAFGSAGKFLTLTTYDSSNQGRGVHRHNTHKLDLLFHIERPIRIRKSLAFVCDQMIHSYVFSPVSDEQRRVTGVLFCSDRQRNKQLYQITLDEVRCIFSEIAADYPQKAAFKWSDESLDYEEVQP